MEIHDQQIWLHEQGNVAEPVTKTSGRPGGKSMRQIRLCLSMVLIICTTLPSPNLAQQANDSSCCTVTAQALDAAQRIKKDMFRADVEKDFLLDGGLFSREQSVYTYRRCPFIKIRVSFTLDPSSKDFSQGSPRDVVQAVSLPYIDYPVRD